MPPPTETPLGRPRLPTTAGATILAVLLYLLAAAPGALVSVLWVEAFETDGPSMEPTLMNGDRFILDRTAVGLFLPGASESALSWASPEPGELVVVHSPADEVDIVKRVVGIGGDTIEIRDGEVFRNGVSLGREPFSPCAAERPAECFEEHLGARRWQVACDPEDAESTAAIEIPEGHVYVLGDHRDRSNDSRNPRIGPVPLSRVIGVVRYRYFSPAGAPMGWL